MGLKNGSRKTRIIIEWLDSTPQTVMALVKIEFWKNGKNAGNIMDRGAVAEFRADVSINTGSRSIRFYGISDGEYIPSMTEEESQTIKAMLIAYADAKCGADDSCIWTGLEED